MQTELDQKEIATNLTNIDTKIKGLETKNLLKFASEHIYHLFDNYISEQLGRSSDRDARFDNAIKSALTGKIITDENDRIYLNEPSLKRRLLGSAELALYYLVKSGELDRKLAQVMSQFPKDAAPKDVSELKSQLVKEYLKKVIDRSREEKEYDDPYSPTIGLEAEFVTTTQAGERMKRIRKLLRRPLRRYIGQEKMGTLTNSNEDQIFKALRYGSGGTLQYDNMGETAFEPTASYATQLRDLLNLIKTDKMPEDLYVHITLGDVKIDEDHPELLEMQSLLIATGYSRNPYRNRLVGDKPSNPFLVDTIPKTSSNWKYYPLLKVRPKADFRTYKGTVSAVELRGLSRHDSFMSLARTLKDVFALGKAVKAHQKKPNHADEIDGAYARIWDETSREWHQLLEKNNILFTDDLNYDYSFAATKYQYYLGEVAFLAGSDPAFEFYAREIVIRARAKIAKIDRERKKKNLETSRSPI